MCFQKIKKKAKCLFNKKNLSFFVSLSFFVIILFILLILRFVQSYNWIWILLSILVILLSVYLLFKRLDDQNKNNLKVGIIGGVIASMIFYILLNPNILLNEPENILYMVGIVCILFILVLKLGNLINE